MNACLHSRHAPTSTQSGTTLIEMIVSLAIIAIGVLGLMSTLTHLSRTSMAAQETTIAANAARAKLDEIGGMTFSRAIDTYEDKNVTFAVPGLVPSPAGTATALRVGNSPTVLEIVVSLSWESATSPRSVTYQTRMTSR